MVGGPIQYAFSDKEFHKDLEKVISGIIEEFIKLDFKVFSAHMVEDFGRNGEYSPHSVTTRDYEWLQQCDAFIAVLPVRENDEPLRSDGTHIEIGWASALSKPIVLVTQIPLSNKFCHLVKGLGGIATIYVVDYNQAKLLPSIVTTTYNKHRETLRKKKIVNEST